MKKGNLNELRSAFKEEVVPEELFTVYCKQYSKDKLNPIGLTNINNFRDGTKRTFKAYMKLKTGGMDKVSEETETCLKKAVNDENYNIICRYFEGINIVTCMRWFVRGLSLGDAIRKVQVDQEVAENALKATTKLIV